MSTVKFFRCVARNETRILWAWLVQLEISKKTCSNNFKEISQKKSSNKINNLHRMMVNGRHSRFQTQRNGGRSIWKVAPDDEKANHKWSMVTTSA